MKNLISPYQSLLEMLASEVPETEQQRRASLLGLVAVATIIACAAALPLLPFMNAEPYWYIVLGGEISLCSLSLLLARLGKIDLAARLFCHAFNLMGLAGFFLSYWLEGNPAQAAALMGTLNLTILFASILVDARSSLRFAAFNSLIILLPALLSPDFSFASILGAQNLVGILMIWSTAAVAAIYRTLVDSAILHLDTIRSSLEQIITQRTETVREQAQALVKAERRQRDMADALRNAADALTSTLDFEEVLDRILDNVGLVIPHDASNITRIDDGILRYIRVRGYSPDKTEELLSRALRLEEFEVARQMVDAGLPHAVPYISRDPRWRTHETSERMQSYAGAPIKLDGEVIGFINVDSRTPGYFSQKDAERLHLFAQQAATAIRNARLYSNLQQQTDMLRRQSHFLEALHHTALALLNRLDLPNLMQTILQEAIDLLGVDAAAIYLVSPDEKVIEQTAGIGVLGRAAGTRLKPGEGLVGQVWQKGKPVVLEDYAGWEHRIKGRTYIHAHANLGVPLSLKDTLIGVLLLAATDSAHRFSETDLSMMQQFARLVVLGIDNTRLIAQMEDARRSAEVANQAKSIFLANMSHELRTPLNAILGFAQLMERNASLNAEDRDHLAVISRSGEHLLTLINDVLEMSKIEAGKVEVQKSGFDLYRMLDGLYAMFLVRAEKKGLSLVLRRSDDLPRAIRTDEGKLRQVLTNLLSNAIKFTETGYVTLEAGFVPPEPGTSPRLHFAVTDTGPGISPPELEKLFDAFVQTSSGIKSHEGTGLGLPISRQFVNLLGGEIEVESQLGAGSTFRFDIRVDLLDVSDLPDGQPAQRVIGLAPDQPTYRILIVEDRWENRALMTRLLTPLGFEVREASNGYEGIAQFEDWRPHLVFMDMRMPIIDGYEATKIIKATEQGQATAIIALTASALEHERTAILLTGCDDFIRKPFQEAVIFEKLQRHLGVKYLYEDRPIAPPSLARPPGEGLTREAFRPLDEAQRAAIHRYATMADSMLLKELVEGLRPAHPELAARLDELVNAFRFDIITALTAPVEAPANGGD